MKALARHLIGRRIVAVDFRPFDTGRGERRKAHDPLITLDNSRKLFFLAEETEVGEYGTMICVTEDPAVGGRPKKVRT